MIFWFVYYGLFRDSFHNGQSWGKRLCGLKVIELEGNRPCSRGASFTRNFPGLTLGFIAFFLPLFGWLLIFFFLILILVLGLLAAGGYYVYKFHLLEGEEFAVNLPLPLRGEKEATPSGDEKDTFIGAWYGKGEFDEEGYLKFNADGTLDLAAPSEGMWTTVEYRIEKEGGISYLEFYDSEFESWDRIGIIEQLGKDKLTLTEWDITIEMNRISDRQFQNVINDLTFEKIY